MRDPGRPGGFPVIVLCDEGWFWIIPLDERRTSVGLVMHAEWRAGCGVPPTACSPGGSPAARSSRAHRPCRIPRRNHVIADFSYRCQPCAGPGYFLAGDAATFVDPVFSTGVCLGMMSGREAARGVAAFLRGEPKKEAVRRRYIHFVTRSTAPFFRLIHLYYDPSFRELFLDGQGPLDVHRAIISILAGHVFPRLKWSLRWRMWAFEFFLVFNRHFRAVPHRERFSLLATAPPPPLSPHAPTPRACRGLSGLRGPALGSGRGRLAAAGARAGRQPALRRPLPGSADRARRRAPRPGGARARRLARRGSRHPRSRGVAAPPAGGRGALGPGETPEGFSGRETSGGEGFEPRRAGLGDGGNGSLSGPPRRSGERR